MEVLNEKAHIWDYKSPGVPVHAREMLEDSMDAENTCDEASGKENLRAFTTSINDMQKYYHYFWTSKFQEAVLKHNE